MEIMLPRAGEKAPELPHGTAGGRREYYLVETEDGSLLRVPGDKLESWEKADHKAPLTSAERQMIEQELVRLYGPRR